MDSSDSLSHLNSIDNFLFYPPQNPASLPLLVEHPSHQLCHTELEILQDDIGLLVEGKCTHYSVKCYNENLESVLSSTPAEEPSVKEPKVVHDINEPENSVGNLALAFAAIVHA